MKDIFERPILEQLYEFRKEDFDQNLYDNNEEIRQIEGKVTEIGEELTEIYKNAINDETKYKKMLEKFREYELAYGKELAFWNREHYKWGLNDMNKLKNEIKFGTSKSMAEDKTFIDFCPSDLDDYIQHKTDFTTEEYKNLRAKYKKISQEYPNVISVMEDLKTINLTEEEMKGLIELRKVELAMRTLEVKLCFKLGMNEILNF